MSNNAQLLLAFTIMLLYISFYWVLAILTLPITFGGYRIGLDTNTIFRSCLEGLLGPCIAGQLRDNDILTLERAFLETRRLIGGQPIPGRVLRGRWRLRPRQDSFREEIDALQEETGCSNIILLMERETLMEHSMAQYREWLRQMESPEE